MSRPHLLPGHHCRSWGWWWRTWTRAASSCTWWGRPTADHIIKRTRTESQSGQKFSDQQQQQQKQCQHWGLPGQNSLRSYTRSESHEKILRWGSVGLSRGNTPTFTPLLFQIFFYFYVLQLKYFHVSTLSVVNMSPCQQKKSAYNFVPAVSGAGGRERAWHWTGVWLNILLTCGGAGRLDTGNKAVNSVLVLPSWREHFLLMDRTNKIKDKATPEIELNSSPSLL